MKRSLLIVTSLIILISVSVVFTSCSKKGKEAEKKKKTIGVSLLKENDDFYITLKKGLREKAEKMGYAQLILSANGDEMKQDSNIDTLLIKKVEAIVICPVNSKGVGSIIKKASDRNIPVFTADIAAEEGRVVAHIASDNYQGGKIAAERMKKEIGKGMIAIVQIPGTESVSARVQGFVDTAKKLGLKIIEPYFNGKDDTQEAERVTNSAILKYKELKGVFAANDNMAEGAEQAIRSSGKDIVLIGYDAAPAAQEKIKAGGPWKADVIQYPYKIGEKTIETIDKYFKGELKESEETLIVPVEVGMVDKESL
ncbi:MAG: hypothetical protein COS84_07810 [Armatimonadetes bacterium CG07_land_8_20_14_0_80_40_9]|nr:MAG: hypothetical protein COS84_07810 [Armatimonadetes bacterium CG07_land_8_20_14_0_80_40_9]